MIKIDRLLGREDCPQKRLICRQVVRGDVQDGIRPSGQLGSIQDWRERLNLLQEGEGVAHLDDDDGGDDDDRMMMVIMMMIIIIMREREREREKKKRKRERNRGRGRERERERER